MNRAREAASCRARTRWTKFHLHPSDMTMSVDPQTSAGSVTYAGFGDGVTFLTEPLVDELAQAAPAAETEFSAEDAQAVHAAMDQLSPEHREVLLLRFMEDMSYEEIAQVAECNVGTVKSRVFNAKRALRTVLIKPGAS